MEELHEMHEDDGGFAREAFGAVAAATTPRLGFGVEDVVRGGRARVRRRRWTAGVGGVALAAAVGVGVAGFGAGAWGPTRVAAAATPAQRAERDGKLAYQAMEKVLQSLDPSGRHLRLDDPVSAAEFAQRPSACNSVTGSFEYMATGRWTADGDPATDTTPHLNVMVVFGDPKADVQGPKGTVTLPDHSVAGASTRGTLFSGTRTLADGRSLQVDVWDASTDQNGAKPEDPVVPFPYTEQQLLAVVSDLSLKFPFADGYVPAMGCPGAVAR